MRDNDFINDQSFIKQAFMGPVIMNHWGDSIQMYNQHVLITLSIKSIMHLGVQTNSFLCIWDLHAVHIFPNQL